MNKSKALRIGGFTLAVGVTASLVGFAAHGTGAYFIDSHPGTINAGTGHVKVISTGSLDLNFADLIPGEYQQQTINYTSSTTSSKGEDIWLVFPTGPNGAIGTTGTSSDYSTNPSEAFTGNPDDGSNAAHAPGALGSYGHFAVTAPAGSFTSYNLAHIGTNPHEGTVCTTDADGHGGSNAQQATKSAPHVSYCAPPTQILLSSGLGNGGNATATLTFGYTPLLKGPQDSGLGQVVSYELVATQHGVLPNDPNN